MEKMGAKEWNVVIASFIASCEMNAQDIDIISELCGYRAEAKKTESKTITVKEKACNKEYQELFKKKEV